ncbi:alpha-(1,3)-fucosyltransferase 4-like [Hippocampus comes]|uniref:alpha-(1,3)-fucosyltransferase 4-like n=1 Tax=Hippocampus comes TaxID=109280 RepID=UPI00094ECC9F|nr:PREDICTED: alpha-(1,3)-fucosyltransferase 4-like [Hippocampus comes]XP_019743114.1 PREDICTED: alpha-(1,3)-fucosyltransferase 4-like [Hippocampus comes]XP_019743115.1 PREDICTED: alpha-(1,3)-fucosyltransferase 4-like [Hippocampus comes]
MGVWARRTRACSKRRPDSCKCDCHFLTAGLVAAAFLVLLGFSLPHLPEPLALEPATTAPEVTLLIWTHPFGRKRPLPDCLARYGVDGCVLTDDRFEYARADGVLVHHRDVAAGTAELPPEVGRPSGQKWIWLNYESPSHTPDLWRLEGRFNLTMTYRADSDIFLPYGYLVHKHGGGQPLSEPSRTSRPGLVAWVVSNWVDSQARVAFYYQLSQYIQVDVFGRAGHSIPEGLGSVVRLVKHYHFYLALENSQHTDYITEKLWNAVLAGAVPVVLGPTRKNYERFLPPEAFIHVDDFPSVKALALYLLALRRDPARLLGHLRWRTGFGLRQPAFWGEHYCTACRALRKNIGRTHVVRDLTRWFES